MKKITKTFINLIAVLMLLIATVGMSACEDIKQITVNVRLYNFTSSEFYSDDDVSFDIDLYRHLAPKTVDAVISHVNNGYYDNAIFYTDSSTNNELIMFGDLKMDADGNITQNLIDGKLPSQIYGEFENNGTTGSDIRCAYGSVGIFRSYYANDEDFTVSSTARDSGRATIFMPQGTYSTYHANFCFFGKFDTEDENTERAMDAIESVFDSSDNYESYVIYFTGDYDSAKPDENFGLTFHCLKKSDFDELEEEDIGDIFSAEGEQLVSYNKTTIRVPKIITKSESKESSAYVKSIVVK